MCVCVGIWDEWWDFNCVRFTATTLCFYINCDHHSVIVMVSVCVLLGRVTARGRAGARGRARVGATGRGGGGGGGLV